jgi:hypothetical protein
MRNSVRSVDWRPEARFALDEVALGRRARPRRVIKPPSMQRPVVTRHAHGQRLKLAGRCG